MTASPHAEALMRERLGYERRGLAERVAAVDAELERLGVHRGDASPGRVETAVQPPRETVGGARPARSRRKAT